MNAKLSIGLGVALAGFFGASGVAKAGTITAQGNVSALDDVTQLPSIVGSALFDEEFSGNVPLDQYPGMTLHVGELSTMLVGVTEMGDVPDPGYTSPGVHFPYPIAGGGVQNAYILLSGAAATFDQPITQFGLTAGGSAITHITVWDTSGVMIGQVTWTPQESDAGFVGVDTNGVAIGLLTVGSDDIWSGMPYDDLGPAANSDTWIWGLGDACQTDADCLEDTWSCTARQCLAGACTYPLTTEPCDDDDACTQTDTCSEALCAGVPVDCDDLDICTFDSCDPRSGCDHAAIDGCCMTTEDCPLGQTCLIGSNTCVGGPGDGDGDTTTTTTESGSDTSSDEVGSTDETGSPSEAERGCGCAAQRDPRGAIFGLLALGLLGGLRRRRSGMFSA